MSIIQQQMALNLCNILACSLHSLLLYICEYISPNLTRISALYIRIKELEMYPQNNQVDKSFDVQFHLPFEDLRARISSSFSKNNAVSRVSFSAKVDVVNRKLTDIQIG